MYTQVWNKYLPVIKILLKRIDTGEQTLSMNLTDFEKAAAGRRDSFSFHIHFREGRSVNALTSHVAKDLAAILLADEKIKQDFVQREYHFQMNKKFQLTIKLDPASITKENASGE